MYFDPPPEVVDQLRVACTHLPEAYEEKAWAGARWRVRKRTFVQVLDVDTPKGNVTVMTFRSSGPELEVLLHTGHPFFRAGWGSDVVGMVVDDATDWEEVAELLTESYCILAPKKLVAQIERPNEAD